MLNQIQKDKKKTGAAFIILFVELPITFWASSQIRNNMGTDQIMFIPGTETLLQTINLV